MTSVLKRLLPIGFLAFSVLLTGCDVVGDARPSGPPTTTATPSRSGTELAARYRQAGGDADIYGIRHAKGEKGFPVLSVWTHKKGGYQNFDDIANSLTLFLSKEGVRLDRGYLLNAYAPDGTRLHSLDTVPEHNWPQSSG
ncbi:hypothetical protein ACFC0M_05270 [Streptomyces sp. NPDC056149]|uniref:hypothetical protein n=1 Tax=Streptomyces sp. NPDC056149 TaxID=3345728 RepID=UPI0035DE1268